MNSEQLQDFLNKHYEYYETNFNIEVDPISIPYQFRRLQDVEISGLFASILAWGNRKAILKSCNQLMKLMDDTPYDFIKHHKASDLKPLTNFVYRTFNGTDLLYLIAFLQHYYQQNESLESAFHYPQKDNQAFDMREALVYFHNNVFHLDYAPDRTRKHIGTPEKKSACKRINMYLRWMVRQNSKVDFGLWNNIQPKDLVCPLDIHVSTTARNLGLLERKQDDWKAAIELTSKLKSFDEHDPVKYDLVLFSLGAEKRIY